MPSLSYKYYNEHNMHSKATQSVSQQHCFQKFINIAVCCTQACIHFMHQSAYTRVLHGCTPVMHTLLLVLLLLQELLATINNLLHCY
jgi:hypothetical protein